MVRLHQRDGRHDRNAGLTDAHDVHVAPECLDHRDNIVDVIVEREGSRAKRDEARVQPIRDVHIGVWQHRFHRAAQKRGEMAGQRRNDQHARLVQIARRHILLEVDEIAERLTPDDLLGDADGSDRSQPWWAG